MKRLAIALCVITLLAIISPSLSILAQPSRVPHEDPAMVMNSPDPVSLLSFYGIVFNLAAISQYPEAQANLTELEFANIRDELSFLIERYNSQSQQLFTSLDQLENLLGEASALLASSQISGVRERLNQAEGLVNSVQLRFQDIGMATTTLMEGLGVFAAPAGSDLRLAAERFLRVLERLKELIERLNQLRQRLAQEFQGHLRLITPELTLDVTPTTVFVGDMTIASGRLSHAENPLGNRQLTLVLDDKPLDVTTDTDGSFTQPITIPYKYVSTMTLTAIFTPSGVDFGTYLATTSRSVTINTRFYSTKLEVLAPGIAHPGLTFTISGQLSSTGSPRDRTIKVFLDNRRLAEETIGEQFKIPILTLPQTATGEHTLVVIVIPQERYGGTSKELPINISRLPIQADINVPRLAILPRSMEVSGQVYHSLGPLPDAKVSLRLRDSLTTVTTSAAGSFSGSIKVPFDLSLIGPQDLTISIEPTQPWYTSLQRKGWVFLINSTNIGLMLIAFISLGLLVFSRVRTRAAPPKGVTISEAEPPETPTSPAPPRPKYKLTGIKGKIISVYLEGLETVERVTSTVMMPHHTLREFLNIVTPKLAMATQPFTELTIVAELVLYSARESDENTVIRAEQLATRIKEVLLRGAS